MGKFFRCKEASSSPPNGLGPVLKSVNQQKFMGDEEILRLNMDESRREGNK